MTTFTEKVYAYVKTIPAGQVRTYGEVAAAIGYPLSTRAVGSALAKNYDKEVPCHRVIKSDGSLGNYNRGGVAAKKKILEREGYDFTHR